MQNLKLKKEDLFKKPQTIMKWELDPKEKIDKNDLIKNKDLALEKIVDKETNNVNNQKQIYGFYLNRIIVEYERMQNVNAERHLKETISIFEKLTDITTDFLTSLSDSNMALSKKESQNIRKKERKKER